MVVRLADGRMQCHVATETRVLSCEQFIFDQQSEPDTRRPKAFGFYDPEKICERQQVRS